MLYKVDTFDDIKLNDSAYIEADVEDFTLDYTATIISSGLFKEIEDDDLNKLSSSLNDLSDLNEKIDDIHDYEINELFTDLRWYPATAITQIGKEFPNTIENNFVLYVQKELNQEEALEYLKSQIKGIENAVMYKENINKYLFNVHEVTLN